MPSFTNNLINETSPYLLQHAHNPVNWYAWSDEAFQKALAEDKPVLVSIGYAACHWCHVMEHESFEDEKIAAFMNEHFINIKVDREERADVDHIYMQACQLLTGSGGWPMNMFLTPDLRPFTGGTYFPPSSRYGKPGWMDVLTYVEKMFRDERDNVEQQAETLMAHMLNGDVPFTRRKMAALSAEEIFSPKDFLLIHKNLQAQFDTGYGGFGDAPKFPSSMLLMYLLRKNFYTPDEQEIKHIHLSLKRMMYGGIYDQLGGGFARYAVDRKWLAPHFEKMLYDNALLIHLYAEAFMVYGDLEYKRITDETMQFILREMTSEENAFYSSYDADSEGEEGKYYTWTKKEIETILGTDAELFCDIYHVTEKGNWENVNILVRNNDKAGDNEYALLTKEEEMRISLCRQKLLAERNKRIKPGLDDKIILSWNACMISACVMAYRATGNEEYKLSAQKNLQFILNSMQNIDEPYTFFRTYKNGKAKYAAMHEDYAALLTALLDFYQVSGDISLLEKAVNINSRIGLHFSAENEILFYFTGKDQKDILFRKIEIYDHATPSGNALMYNNLRKLAHITGKAELQERADKMFSIVKDGLGKYPSSYGMWLNGTLAYSFPSLETVISGDEAEEFLKKINRIYHPGQIVMADKSGENSNYPLLQNRFVKGKTFIYNCRNAECKNPVITIDDYREQIKGL